MLGMSTEVFGTYPRTKKSDYYYLNERGEGVSRDLQIPKGDINRMLGYKPITEEERRYPERVRGWRAVEVALLRAVNRVSAGALRSGTTYINQYISNGEYEGAAGRKRGAIDEYIVTAEDGAGGLHRAFDAHAYVGGRNKPYMSLLEDYHRKSRDAGLRYIEMLHKCFHATIDFDVLTDLMKVRNAAVKSSMQDLKLS